MVRSSFPKEILINLVLNWTNVFTTPVNVVPLPVSDWLFIDPSVLQATGPVLPSTSVKTSGSDKYKHKKKSKSSKKSALPATDVIDAESKISCDATVQPPR